MTFSGEAGTHLSMVHQDRHALAGSAVPDSDCGIAGATNYFFVVKLGKHDPRISCLQDLRRKSRKVTQSGQGRLRSCYTSNSGQTWRQRTDPVWPGSTRVHIPLM